MSIRNALLIAASGLAMASAVAFAAESPNLGRVATPEEIAPWDISIGPDGVGLPPGGGTPKQGEAVYAAKCVACHGEKGAGHYQFSWRAISPRCFYARGACLEFSHGLDP